MELRKAWCAATAHPSYQKDWKEDNPSYGQCCVTALMVQDLHGGDIYSCKVGNNSHFVNIIDERIIDETAEQFGGTDKIKYVNGSFRKRSRESLLQNQDIKQRYELLKARLEE